MLLSPITHVPSDKSEGPKFDFHTPQPGETTTSLVVTAIFWVFGLFAAFSTALSTPGFWGQGIGKASLSGPEDPFSLTLLGCLLVVVQRSYISISW